MTQDKWKADSRRPGEALWTELVDLMGEELSFQFVKRFGGNQIYVPRMVHLFALQRNRLILKQHFVDGRTARDLGVEHGITATRVRQIIKKAGGGRRK